MCAVQRNSEFFFFAYKALDLFALHINILENWAILLDKTTEYSYIFVFVPHSYERKTTVRSTYIRKLHNREILTLMVIVPFSCWSVAKKKILQKCKQLFGDGKRVKETKRY